MVMKKWIRIVCWASVAVAALAGCERYEPPEPEPVGIGESLASPGQGGQDFKEPWREEDGQGVPGEGAAEGSAQSGELKGTASGELEGREEERRMQEAPSDPVKVKGIYVSAYVAGTPSLMEEIIQRADETELNAVVIDVKDDNGRITFAMDSPLAREMGACEEYIPDMEGLLKTLGEHGIYRIARIPAFRDSYLGQVRPEWCCRLGDGSLFLDRSGQAWANPYKREVWDYLEEIASKAGEAGFDEIQFDYIRFCTERGMDQVVFEDEDTGGKSRQEIILEFVEYMKERLGERGLLVSADVFGVVISGGSDAQLVGQTYESMAKALDAICPMIYPSHYGDGYFGIAHPDTQPYDTVLGALSESAAKLSALAGEDVTVRPWLQDFTASYLPHHITYGPQQVREQIQAVYDAGYEEWILWNASSRYHYDGLMAAEEGSAPSGAMEPEALPQADWESRSQQRRRKYRRIIYGENTKAGGILPAWG